MPRLARDRRGCAEFRFVFVCSRGLVALGEPKIRQLLVLFATLVRKTKDGFARALAQSLFFAIGARS